jgi:hypothetical protein
VRPRRHHGRVVMRGQIRIGPVDHRVVEARPGEPRIRVRGWAGLGQVFVDND